MWGSKSISTSETELRAQAGGLLGKPRKLWLDTSFYFSQPDFRMTFRPTSPSPKLASPAFLCAIMHSRRAPVAKRSQSQGRATPNVRPGKDGALVTSCAVGSSVFCSVSSEGGDKVRFTCPPPPGRLQGTNVKQTTTALKPRYPGTGHQAVTPHFPAQGKS